MRYLSLFSGVETASLAAERLGWEPVAFCEVDEYPAAVLAHRWPDVTNLGDITKVDWDEFKERHGAVRVVVGGFHCQSYSISGLRKGLDDPRGDLMLEFLRACKKVDPEWVVGENVPGLLSSNGGRDFKTLLEAVAILWPRGGIAWRVLDAQFARVPMWDGDGGIAGWFGPVPQRRRRLFLVVNTRDWRRAAAVLAESEGVFGDFVSGKEKRKALAADAARGSDDPCARDGLTSFKWFQGANARSIAAYDDGSTCTLTNSDSYQPAVAFSEPMVMASLHYNAEIGVDGLSPSIISHAAKDPPYMVARVSDEGERDVWG